MMNWIGRRAVQSLPFHTAGSTVSSNVFPAMRSGVAIEFVLFFFSILAVAAGGLGVLFGVLNSPLSMMVVGDWYVTTSGLLIVLSSTDERPTIVRAIGALALAAAGAYALLRAFGVDVGAKEYVKLSMSAAAVCAIVTQFAIGLRADSRARRDHLRVACFAAALVILPITSSWGVQMTTFISKTYDHALLAMGDSLGIRIPALVRAAVWNNSIADYVTFHVYISISLAMVAYDIVWRDFKNWEMTKLLLVSSVVGFVFYFIVPVAGTTYLLPHYNPAGAPGALSSISDPPRNCMPSLHTTWGCFSSPARSRDGRRPCSTGPRQRPSRSMGA